MSTETDETAAILFTSGSTGIPKGAIYSHGNFLAQVEVLRQVYGIQPGEVDLATFPLFALFGPALGMTAVVPDMNPTRPARVDPLKIIEAVRDFGVTHMFGSPALLDRIGRYGAAAKVVLPSLRRVISAGAPVQPAIIERFSAMLSGDAQIFTPYGATEALPVCSIGSREILADTAAKTGEGAGVCVGVPVPGLRVEVVAIDDDPLAAWSEDLALADGHVGEIIVKGPVVTRAYFNRDESTVLAKVRDPSDGGIWHRMGDLGYRDERGRIWFCGRKSQRVIAAHGPMFTLPCEGVFNAHPRVYRSALVGIADGDRQRPVLCVEPDHGVSARDRPHLREELFAMGSKYAHTAVIDRILFHPRFPVDIRHNAKIFREKLAVWAARRPGSEGVRGN